MLEQSEWLCSLFEIYLPEFHSVCELMKGSKIASSFDIENELEQLQL